MPVSTSFTVSHRFSRTRAEAPVSRSFYYISVICTNVAELSMNFICVLSRLQQVPARVCVLQAAGMQHIPETVRQPHVPKHCLLITVCAVCMCFFVVYECVLYVRGQSVMLTDIL